MENATLNFDYETMNKEIRMIIVREARKSPAKMDMNLIRDGLDYLHPFNEQEDELRTRIAWNDFQSRYVSQYAYRLTHTRTVRKVIAITVLMVLLLATTICYALGVDLLSIVVNWTKDQLNVVISPNDMIIDEYEQQNAEYDERIRSIWGEDLCDRLTQMNIAIQLPAWRTNEYELQIIEGSEEEAEQKFLYALYTCKNGKSLIITVQQFNDLDAYREYRLAYEADGNIQEVHRKNNIDFYILSNLDAYSVMWCRDLVAIFISGDITYEEVYQIIESVD